MCMKVDLPEPDGPVTDRNSPRAHIEVDAAQRLHLVIADDVRLHQAAGRDDAGTVIRHV